MSESERYPSAEEQFGKDAVEHTALGGDHNPFEGVELSDDEQKDLDEKTGAHRAKLEKAYWQDELTGIYKYHADPCKEFLQQTLNRAERNNQPVTFAIYDLDYFKVANDRYGRPFGDLVLQGFAKALDEGSRVSDTAFRMAGEEFGILLPGMTADHYDEINSRILVEWRKELEGLRGKLKELGVSPRDGREITDSEIDRFVTGLTFSGGAMEVRPSDLNYEKNRGFKYPKLDVLRKEVDHLSEKAKEKRNITIFKDRDGKTREITNMDQAADWVTREELDTSRYKE